MEDGERPDHSAKDINAFFDAPSRRTLVKVGLTSMLLSPLLSACDEDDPSTPPTTGPTPSPTQVSSFGLAVLPDTQFYSRYATEDTGNQFGKRYGSEPFSAQTRWIAANAAALRIPFVIHVGDVVDQATRPQQWAVADQAMKVLEDACVPYSILAGNHDVRADVGYDPRNPEAGTDAIRDLGAEPYLTWFSRDRAARQPTFRGRDASGFHEYHIFEAQGQRFMVLSLSWRASTAAITWARGVIAANPTLPVILVNHELIGIANDGVSPLEVEYGKMIWDKLIRDNDQIFMTLNGHFHGSSRLTKTNDFGNAVEEMVVDYQMAYQGGNALMRFYEFDLINKQIKAVSFSPWVRQKPAATINQFDRAVLTEPNNQFTIAMDFRRRFARFNPGFSAGLIPAAPLTQAATALATDGFTAPMVPPARPASGPEDYPKVADTRAHWRFGGGGPSGGAVADGAVIADRSGNDFVLTRGPLVGGAMADDLIWSDDRHRLSSASGSVVFRNTAGSRLSYFLTTAQSGLNREVFTSGYTVEAFVKVAKEWTAANNAFMAMMSRAGRRGNLPQFAGGLPQSPPLQFAFSNLREVQWEVVPERAAARGSRTNWSGEIQVDTWFHVAVVNDPSAGETTMYIEGAPVLRNAIDGVGLATLGLPWTVGAGYWDGGGPGSGFLGAIGEIRIVARPRPPSEWLTARAS